MKKLKLDQQKFAGAEVLSRAQLRKVMGGTGSGNDDHPCWATYPYEGSLGCGYRVCSGVIVDSEPIPEGADVKCDCEVFITASHPCGWA